MQLAAPPIRQQIRYIQVQICLPCRPHPPHIIFVQNDLGLFGAHGCLRRDVALTVKGRAVFRFEVPEKFTEEFHRVGEVDRRSPDGTNFIGFFGGGCRGGKLRCGGGGDGEVIGIGRGESIEVAAVGARGPRGIANARGSEAQGRVDVTTFILWG